jgi:hypothetical protein
VWWAAVLGCTASHRPSDPISSRPPRAGSVTWHTCGHGQPAGAVAGEGYLGWHWHQYAAAAAVAPKQTPKVAGLGRWEAAQLSPAQSEGSSRHGNEQQHQPASSQQQHLQPSSSLLASGSAATASPASASPRVRAMLRPPGQTLMGPTGLPSTLEGQTSQPASRHRFTSSLLSSSRWLPLICRAGRQGRQAHWALKFDWQEALENRQR